MHSVPPEPGGDSHPELSGSTVRVTTPPFSPAWLSEAQGDTLLYLSPVFSPTNTKYLLHVWDCVARHFRIIWVNSWMNGQTNKSYGTHNFYTFGFFSFTSAPSVPNLVTTQIVWVTTLGIPGPAQDGNEERAAATAEGKPLWEGSAASSKGRAVGNSSPEWCWDSRVWAERGAGSRLLWKRWSVRSGTGQTRVGKLGAALRERGWRKMGEVKVAADWGSEEASRPREMWSGTWEVRTDWRLDKGTNRTHFKVRAAGERQVAEWEGDAWSGHFSCADGKEGAPDIPALDIGPGQRETQISCALNDGVGRVQSQLFPGSSTADQYFKSNLLGRIYWFAKPYRFQENNSIKCHLYPASCAHQVEFFLKWRCH